MENRFKMLTKSKPADAKILFGMAQEDVENRYRLYEFLASRKLKPDATAVGSAAGAQPGATTVTA